MTAEEATTYQPTRTSAAPHVERAASSRAGHKVLVAIPCFNEEIAVAGIVIRARRHADQVVVVDDGSKDRTAENGYLAGAVVLQHAHNLGKGAAVRTAFRYAVNNGFTHLVLIDGDGQHDPEEIPLVLGPVQREKPVDLALGFRFGANTQMPGYRRVGKRVLDYATAASSGAPVTDSQCGFRAFGPKAIPFLARSLRSDQFAIESEMLVHAKDAGLSMENVTIHCRYDDIDGSTKSPVTHGLSVLEQIVVMLTMRRPLLTLGVPGLLCAIGAAYWAIRLIDLYNDTGQFAMGTALAAATFALLGGILIATALMLNMLLLLRRSLPARRIEA